MTNSDRTLIVIVGPTGSGKTDLSIEIAREFDAPIISTDSRQVFREIPIGTAQPTAGQLRQAEHHFIADRSVEHGFTAGQFAEEALELLGKLFAKHRYVVAVGGSGLYVDALCSGFDDLPLADNNVRQELQRRFDEQGIGSLVEQLEVLDPEYSRQVDRNNPLRVMRALEVCLASGKPYSSLRSGRKAQRDFRIIKIGILTDRAELYERINRRVDEMVAEGLEEEARGVYRFRDMNALQTVGYKEMFDYFDGEITRAEAVELIKRNSRRYAKRQLTWFRRDSDISWFEKKDTESIIFSIKKFAE